MDEILKMREDMDADQIINLLKKNSSTWDLRTAFSKAKWLKRKIKK